MPTGTTHTYVHHVPGRLRVRSPLVKKNERQAFSAITWLRSLPGVYSADANTVTGSLTLRYDPAQTAGVNLMAALKEAGHLDPFYEDKPLENVKLPTSTFQRELGTRVAKTIIVYAVEEAVKALIVALL